MKTLEDIVYIVANDINEYQLLTKALNFEKIKYSFYPTISAAFLEFNNTIPDVLLIDMDCDSSMYSEYCFSIKTNNRYSATKIMFLSSKKDEDSEIKAFYSGADDFIYKPLFPNSLLIRIKNKIRKEILKTEFEKPETQELKRITIDTNSFLVKVENKQVHLSKREFELILYMSSNPGKVFTRDEIFENVWKRKPLENERTLDVHILRLRKKLGENVISTQKGVGYRFRPD